MPPWPHPRCRAPGACSWPALVARDASGHRRRSARAHLAAVVARAAARVHGAGPLRHARRAADHAERQDRPARAAVAGCRTRPSRTRSAGIARALWQDLLGLPEIGDDQNLFDLGARSLLVLRFVSRLQAEGVQGLVRRRCLRSADARRPGGAASGEGGPADAAGASAGRPGLRAPLQPPASRSSAWRSAPPARRTWTRFWQTLLDGREGIRHFALGELDASVPEALKRQPNFVAARGVLEDADRFDAAFFGIPPREAMLLDPQQRLLLELAGPLSRMPPSTRRAHRTRTCASASTLAPGTTPTCRRCAAKPANWCSVPASSRRCSRARRTTSPPGSRNRLNLRGPAVSVHTACSTSLVAVAQAWHSLAAGQCDVALAGGATLLVPQNGGYLHVEGGMESADGHCRPFDADATGTVFLRAAAASSCSSGSKTRSRDDDTIHAVIRGVGLNNDGGSKASFTAPSMAGQAGAIRMALDHAGVEPRSIGYVEAHGTGTSLGDPIEVAALAARLEARTRTGSPAALGSVKGNLGHLTAGAGVVGLIKAALAAVPRGHSRDPALPAAEPADRLRQHAVSRWPAAASPGRAATRPRAPPSVPSASAAPTPMSCSKRRRLRNRGRRCPCRRPPPVPSRHRRAVGRAPAPMAAATVGAQRRGAAGARPGPRRLPASAIRRSRSTRWRATLMRGRRPWRRRACVVAAMPPARPTRCSGCATTVAALDAPRLVFLFPGQGSQHAGMAGSSVSRGTGVPRRARLGPRGRWPPHRGRPAHAGWSTPTR